MIRRPQRRVADLEGAEGSDAAEQAGKEQAREAADRVAEARVLRRRVDRPELRRLPARAINHRAKRVLAAEADLDSAAGPQWCREITRLR